MYVLIAGGGKIGANLARSLLRDGHGHEVTLIEQRRDRYDRLEVEFEHQVQMGDATELHVLERAGIARRPDVVVAVTGDDEDNLVICQLAREKYGVGKVVARVNDPRNQAHFDLLGISATVSATASIMALIEHEVPEHDLIHLLELRRENLEIVEVQIDKNAPAAGKRVEKLKLPDGSRLISITRNGKSELASRSDFVRGVLPPGVPETARVLALAFGLGLVWLSRALARRKRRAWQLAVVLVAASAVAHLAKGLDVEEAAVHLVLLGALWRYRRRFVAPGDPETIRPLVRALAALAAVGVFAALRISDRMAFSERIEEALGLLALALAARALYLWLRPLALRVRQTPPERRLAERLVREHGHDSLAFFSPRRDKSYFFSPSGRGFLAYRVVNGCALVGGDAIGEAGDVPALLTAFRRFAHDHAWRVAILGASAELLPLYRESGLRSIYLGDEAVGFPAEFSLEGRAIRKVRQSVHRVRRAGYH